MQFIEFYSGYARTSLCMKAAGLRTAKCDFKYHYGGGNNYYDILTPAGFASLTQPFMSNRHQSLNILKHIETFCLVYVQSHWFSPIVPRLCIALVLKGRTDEVLVLLGMKCSSFSIVNLGTSQRAICCPWGDWTKPSVKAANLMASRKLLFADFF